MVEGVLIAIFQLSVSFVSALQWAKTFKLNPLPNNNPPNNKPGGLFFEVQLIDSPLSQNLIQASRRPAYAAALAPDVCPLRAEGGGPSVRPAVQAVLPVAQEVCQVHEGAGGGVRTRRSS